MSVIPNFLGFFRLAMAPVVLLLIVRGAFELAFWIFVLAGLSDAFDGYTARRLNATSEFGRFLDPFADKVLLNLTFVALGASEMVPVWLVILVFLRDFLLGLSVSIARARGSRIPMDPHFISKLNTALQVTLVGFVLAAAAYNWDLGAAVPPASVLVAITTVASGLLYLHRLVQTARAA